MCTWKVLRISPSWRACRILTHSNKWMTGFEVPPQPALCVVGGGVSRLCVGRCGCMRGC